MVETKCPWCKKPFNTIPSVLKKGGGKFCSVKCYGLSRRGKPTWGKGKHLSVETKEKISRARLGTHPSDEARKAAALGHIGKIMLPQTKRALLLSRIGTHHSEEAKRKISEANKGQKRSSEYKRRKSESMRALWQKPEYAMGQQAKRHVRPTQPELKLKGILERHFPEFKYNGDLSLGVVLGGLIPDFVNVNGRKQVIEVFGDYWHSDNVVQSRWRGGELGRIMAYNSLGFNCLILWQHQILKETEDSIVNVIKTFVGGQRKGAK